ncbi:flagellar biosynthesis anti-sigma factor FlgM [Candidatus Puniceispirillum sp.]|nr:flagellar biosynthesis anti-sigma factor FlgM [Alphaproteobacteria bacterium]MDC1293738.1 flagellar biosynthesis anti-sigma factor FlgM [Candidatus Puniceispirillum sp.]
MVEISKNVASRPEVRANPNKGSGSAKPVTNIGSLESQADSVKLNSLESQPVVKDMASAAPINKENVNRIKDAIRRGEYPIDLDRVTDALMEAYKEMKT